MKYIAYDRPGEPNQVLEVREKEIPKPRSNEVLVKMKSMPIVPADLATIRGVYRTPQTTPSSPGYEGFGEVVAIGNSVHSFKIGQHVLLLPFKKTGWTNGSWQEFVCADETEMIGVPEGVDFDSIPQFFNTTLTAWVMVVDELNIRPGQTALVTAAGSGVGRLILKLAKEREFSAIAVVRRPEQVEEIRALGATDVICSSTEDIQKRVMNLTKLKGVDAVLDAVGGKVSTDCFRSMSENGKMIVYGLLDLERNSNYDVRKMLFYGLRVGGFWLPGWWFKTDLKARTQAMNRTFELAQKGILKPVTEREYSLNEIKEAVAHSERPGNKGRIMLVVK